MSYTLYSNVSFANHFYGGYITIVNMNVGKAFSNNWGIWSMLLKKDIFVFYDVDSSPTCGPLV